MPIKLEEFCLANKRLFHVKVVVLKLVKMSIYRDKIVNLIDEAGLSYKEKERTIYTTCPECGKDDKLSILKANGATICYRGSCGFKGFFDRWLAATMGITIEQARAKLKTSGIDYESELQVFDNETVSQAEQLQTIDWPLPSLVAIDSQNFPEGLNYLNSRGITKEVAAKYGIMYCPSVAQVSRVWTNRVYLPVRRGGKVYGFQARSISPTEPHLRMLNNTGFRRDALVMFEDNLKGCDHVILCEGPFDAMKFDVCGGAVATMGKVVTDKQLKLIESYHPKKVYLALDEDAHAEINKLIKSFTVPVYIVTVPKSCVDRCKAAGKKADFGECTPKECYEAYLGAELADETTLMLSLE